MAIDWSKVEGYSEDMSAEDKLALLEKQTVDIPGEPAGDPKSTKEYVALKAQFDKVSSDLASTKKQLRTKMTEDEQAKADREAADQKVQEELESLRREKALNAHKASYLAMGYDEKTAEAAATAMVDGDNAALFAAMKKHGEATEKALRDKILNDTPTPPAGEPGDDESDGVKLAKRVAQTTAAADKTANDILSKYI